MPGFAFRCLARRYATSSRPTLASAPTLRDFLHTDSSTRGPLDATAELLPPYVDAATIDGAGRSVHIETYGCQMNVSDTEVVQSLLRDAGYVLSSSVDAADVVLLNTCAIRDKAEATNWARLREIRAQHRRARQRGEMSASAPRVVGLLGCMGERLKGRLLENERLVDVVCGPDAYRSLPRLLASARAGQPSLDVALSLEETYADVAPVREGSDGISAFVSIMRGCNNMCSYCIVPFTRGRERSRDAASIAREVAQLAMDGYREVTLLGQNVNSYADPAADTSAFADAAASPTSSGVLREGFSSKVPPPRASYRFAQLMEELALAHPEMRFRFTSPHPKDFPDDLLRVIAKYPNVCESLHIPAQSGSSAVLEAMRRGYTREAYDALIRRVRELLPNAAISSDFISGFCGETEEDHLATLDLLRTTRFDKAFMFAYSLREKTHAHRKLVDDVPEPTKQRRLREVIDTYNEGARTANAAEVGRAHLVLLEGISKRSELEWIGRTDTNKRVVFKRDRVPAALDAQHPGSAVELGPGDYVAVRVSEAISANTLRAVPLARSSIQEFSAARLA